MLKAVLFDIDGTLIDTVDLHARAWQDALRKWGHEVSFEEVREQIGKGGDQLLPVFLSKDDLKDHGEQMSEWRSKHFMSHYFPQAKAFHGVRDLVQAILDKGLKVAIASSAKKDELQQYEKLARIDDLIQVETTSDDAEKSKPHPDIFLAALDRLNIVAKEAVAVGDTQYDAEACRKAGIRVIGVRSGGFPEAALKRAGCAAIYDHPSDLLSHLGDWCADAS